MNAKDMNNNDIYEKMEINDLNDDCLLKTFSYLSLFEKVSLTYVCKRWYDLSKQSLLTEQSVLFGDTIWHSACDDTSHQVIDEFNVMSVLQKKLFTDEYLSAISASFDDSNVMTDDNINVINVYSKRQNMMINEMLKRCPNIKALHLNSCCYNQQLFDIIIDNCRSIECLHMRGYQWSDCDNGFKSIGEKFGRYLRHLQLEDCNDISEDGLKRFISLCPNLESVHIFDCNRLYGQCFSQFGPKLCDFQCNLGSFASIDRLCDRIGTDCLASLKYWKVSIPNSVVYNLCRMSPNIKSLDLMSLETDRPSDALYYISKLRFLKELQIVLEKNNNNNNGYILNNDYSIDNGFLTVLEKCSLLTNIYICESFDDDDSTFSISDISLKKIGNLCPLIYKLIINLNMLNVTDESMKSISQLSHLQSLDLSANDNYGPQITDNGFIEVINSCNKLCYLYISHCKNITEISFDECLELKEKLIASERKLHVTFHDCNIKEREHYDTEEMSISITCSADDDIDNNEGHDDNHGDNDNQNAE